jgi:hypothetical protein
MFYSESYWRCSATPECGFNSTIADPWAWRITANLRRVLRAVDNLMNDMKANHHTWKTKDFRQEVLRDTNFMDR